jgi:aspartyl protease family protein
MRRLFIIVCSMLLLLSPMRGWGDIQIDVVGLFKQAAILNINGDQHLLKAGETSPEGVVLVSADSRKAVIRFEDREMILDLSNQISGRFQQAKSQSVSIAINPRGQYRVGGMVNDRPVSFVVDTGATIVAMNMDMAAALGIDYRQGERRRATTAGGVIDSWEVRLQSIRVGEIEATGVKAAVLEGQFPVDILLGMTFLENIEISESAGLMVLTSKF